MSAREVNQTELAAILGKSTRQIRNYEAEGIPHRAEGNRKFYRLPDAVEWYAEKKRDDALSQIEQADYQQARARREQARARMAEIELDREEGRLITREAVEETYGAILDRSRAAMLNMPGRFGAQIVGLDDPREGEAALKTIARELLEYLSGPVADEIAVGELEADLPDDFPGRTQLERAGVTTLGELLELDELLDVHGVGPVTAQEIVARLEERGYRAA